MAPALCVRSTPISRSGLSCSLRALRETNDVPLKCGSGMGTPTIYGLVQCGGSRLTSLLASRETCMKSLAEWQEVLGPQGMSPSEIKRLFTAYGTLFKRLRTGGFMTTQDLARTLKLDPDTCESQLGTLTSLGMIEQRWALPRKQQTDYSAQLTKLHVKLPEAHRPYTTYYADAFQKARDGVADSSATPEKDFLKFINSLPNPGLQATEPTPVSVKDFVKGLHKAWGSSCDIEDNPDEWTVWTQELGRFDSATLSVTRTRLLESSQETRFVPTLARCVQLARQIRLEQRRHPGAHEAWHAVLEAQSAGVDRQRSGDALASLIETFRQRGTRWSVDIASDERCLPGSFSAFEMFYHDFVMRWDEARESS